MDSHEKVVSRLKTARWHPLVPFLPPYTYHKRQLNPWPNSSTSCVVNYSQLSACQEEIEMFKDHLSTRGHLTSLRKKPQQNQLGKLSAPVPTCNGVVNVYSCRLMVKSVPCYCVCGMWIFSILVIAVFLILLLEIVKFVPHPLPV